MTLTVSEPAETTPKVEHKETPIATIFQTTPRLVILSYWHKLFEDFNTSAQEFYAMLEDAILRREIPEIRMARVELKEAGLLSANREYVRLTRERLIFDIGAGQFGQGFFFSWRLGEIPRSFNILHVIALLFLNSLLLTTFYYLFGLEPAIFLYNLFIIEFIWLSREAISLGLTKLDFILLNMPIFGPFYERFLRPKTYYRTDLVHAYQKAVHGAVMEVIDEITKAKGVKALSEEERKPIMKDLYWK